MPLITWNQEQFSVGIDAINKQHKKWIELINRVHESLMDTGSGISPEAAIGEMIEYTAFHFKQEEDLLKEVQFPGYEKHKLEHACFTLKLEKLDRDIASGTYVLKTQVMSILKNWLEDHICITDKAYGAFILKSKNNT